MNARLAFATLRAESRGARGRLLFVGACLALGVAAVSSVAALAGALEGGIRARSRVLLGGDLAVDSRQPLPAGLDEAMAAAWRELGEGELARTDVRELNTLAASVPRDDGEEPRARLVELEVVGPAWPLYGEIALDPPGTVAALGEDAVAVAPELLPALGVELGDELKIGGERYTIAALVREEPGELGFRFQVGPRVLMRDVGLARTSLLQFGSRVRHRALFAFPGGAGPAELRALVAAVEARIAVPSSTRFRPHHRAQPALRRGLERIERYLGLVALLSLVLGGTGVAQVVRGWMRERTPSIAVLRALGWRPREVVCVYVAHVATLALGASALGALAGASSPWIAALFAGELIDAGSLRVWQPAALARGLALGVAIAVAASLPPLLAVWRVPPARVLRAEAEPLALPVGPRAGAALALAAAVFGAAWWQGGRLAEAAAFTGGLALLAALLVLATRALARLARAAPRQRLPATLAHGIAALGRPGSASMGSIVALGLGVLVVVAMQLIEDRLSSELSGALPPDAPTVFLVDVQPDQWDGLRAALAESDASHVRSVPVVTARLSAIDGEPIAALAERRGGGRARWVLTREQRLTWMEELGEDNRIVAGELWSDPDVWEVSVETEFARDLGVGLGSRLTFDVQGVPVELRVTSLRDVDWRSFGINFFLTAEPGALERAPHALLAAARLEPAAEEALQARLAEGFSNVTPLRVRELIERARAIFERLAFAVRLLGALTVVAGLAILAGVAASTAARRGGEVALLKTLGVTRRGVAGLFATEYALCGLVAGAIGAAFAFGLARTFLVHALELEPALPLASVPLAAAACALLAAAAGLAASARALAVPPIASLR